MAAPRPAKLGLLIPMQPFTRLLCKIGAQLALILISRHSARMSGPDEDANDQSKTVEVRRLTWGEYIPRLLRYIDRGCVGVRWYALVVVFLVGILIFFRSRWSVFGCVEQDIRLSGWLLQLIGFIQVANGLRTTEMAFGKPSPLERLKAYFANFPAREVRSVTVNASGAAVATMSGHGAGVVVRSNPTLEQRVEDIENAVDQLEKNTGKLRLDLSRETSRLDEKMSEVAGDFRERVNEIEERLEDLMIGTSHVEWFGVGLFVLGVTLASASPELASLLGHPSSCR